MHERQQKHKRLLLEKKEVSSKIDEIPAIIDIDVGVDPYENENEEDDKRAICELLDEIYGSRNKLNLIAKNLLEQYCAIFPYELSPALKTIIQKKSKCALKLLSKKGFEMFKLTPKGEFQINFVDHLIWNHFCVNLKTFLQTEKNVCYTRL